MTGPNRCRIGRRVAWTCSPQIAWSEGVPALGRATKVLRFERKQSLLTGEFLAARARWSFRSQQSSSAPLYGERRASAGCGTEHVGGERRIAWPLVAAETPLHLSYLATNECRWSGQRGSTS